MSYSYFLIIQIKTTWICNLGWTNRQIWATIPGFPELHIDWGAQGSLSLSSTCVASIDNVIWTSTVLSNLDTYRYPMKGHWRPSLDQCQAQGCSIDPCATQDHQHLFLAIPGRRLGIVQHLLNHKISIVSLILILLSCLIPHRPSTTVNGQRFSLLFI